MNGGREIEASKVLFYCSLALLVFGYGVAVGTYQIFPYEQLSFMKRSLSLVTEEAPVLTRTAPVGHLQASRYSGAGVTRRASPQTSEGTTMVASFFTEDLGVRLMTADGTILNEWPIRTHEIWDDLGHITPAERRPTTDWNAVLNGSMVLPDGSLVISLFGLVKLDSCGGVVWRTPVMTHHSVEPSMDGGFWVPGQRSFSDSLSHPWFGTPYFDETILEISESGILIREIPVLDLLLENGLGALVFANNRHLRLNVERDLIHLNDVEQLFPDQADSFPMFEAGDLLVSLREPNLVFVFDPTTRRVKWHQVGPWVQQHDPDFQPDGTITVFDNNYDGTEDGSRFGGSRIVRIDPVSGSTEVLFGGSADEFMYTSTQGDHQLLSSGNILIAESTAGRVLEVDTAGRVVWEFLNRWSDSDVLRVADAARYAPDYFEGPEAMCPDASGQ